MSALQYDGATGAIVAFGQFDRAPNGLLLGYVYDDAPLSLPGTKALVAGVVVVTPPPVPTADELAAAQAEATAAQADRDTARQAVAQLLADAASLSDGTVTLTQAQQRAMLARTDRALVALARTLRRQGLI